MQKIEDLLVGFIGRPILTIIKWFRWEWPVFGFLLGREVVINTITHAEISRPTYWPLVIGIILCAIGLTIKRYDEISQAKT